jgi:putative FmdB family regulatory protein
MPTYEYQCQQCKKRLEALQAITAKPLTKCPKCGGKLQRQLSSGMGFLFKGSGFYITDYRSKKYTEAKKKDESSAKPKDESSSKAKGACAPSDCKTPKQCKSSD